VFANAESQPLWLVRADVETGELSVRAINAKAPQPNQSYELWVLPATGNPQSLGLLPVATTKAAKVSHAVASLLANAKGLAVSVEPAGGSPTGLPTGPVVNVTALVRI
jgi:anti-sigma-K factor RskA